MRRFVLGVLAAAIVTLAFGASAQARPWAHCHSWSCVNKRLNSLHQKAARNSRTVHHVVTCLMEAPLTQYGDPAGSLGYLYTNNPGNGYFYTAALDITQPGDQITGRFLFDSCAGTSTAKPIAPKARFGAFSAWQTRAP
jgi:hypothetical protein